MIINGENIFVGAYEERKSNHVIEREKLNHVLESDAAKEAVKTQSGRSATASISQESREFLCSEAGYEKMKKDVEELYSKNALQQKQLMQNKEQDPFWSNTGNQWLVFSESLYKSSFYDNMSNDEVKEVESLLAKITAGMDHVSRTQFATGIEFSDYYGHGANFFMNTNEVNLELESATEALRYFGDKYVDPQNKKGFTQLVDDFHAHNSQIMEGYQSPMESFERAVSSIHSGKYENSAVTNSYNQFMGKEASGIDVSIYLGGITHTRQEKEQYHKNITTLFQNLKEGNREKTELWNQLKEEVVNYASKNSDSQNIRNHILEQNQYTFQRMENYWSDLIS